MTLRRLLGLGAFAIALTFAFFAQRERADMARSRNVAAAQRQLAATPLAPVGAAPRAGISARGNLEVRAIPDRLAKQLRQDADFHHLVHRCGVCHATPDPALHTRAEWTDVIERMVFNIDAAGLLPLTDAERVAVLRVLTRHAR